MSGSAADGAPVQVWTASRGEGLLVALGPTRTPVLDLLVAELPPGPWRALEEYALVSAGGRVRFFDVLPYSLEDDLGVVVPGLVDGALQVLTLTLDTGPTPGKRVRVELRLSGLVPLSNDAPEAVAALAQAHAARRR